MWRNGAVNRENFRRHLGDAAKTPMIQLWQDLSATEQATAMRLATGKGAVPHWEDAQHHLLTIGLAEKDEDDRVRLFSELLTDWLKKGEFQQPPPPRPLNGQKKSADGKAIPPPLQPTPKQDTKPVYAYALALLAMAAISLFIVLVLPLEKAALFLAVLLILILALFVLMGKATVEQFLAGIDKVLRGWFSDN